MKFNSPVTLKLSVGNNQKPNILKISNASMQVRLRSLHWFIKYIYRKMFWERQMNYFNLDIW